MLLSNLNLLATAPDGVAKLRELILTLAVQGKLLPQDPSDEPASVLLKKIRAEKDRLIAEGKIKREKDAPVLSEDEPPFELPATWEWVALGEVIDIVRGITFPASQKTKEAAPGRIACLRTSNVQKSIEWDDLLFVDRSFMGREDQLIQHHDIVMSMANSRELVGKVALIEDVPHAEATFGGFLGVLRPRKILPIYAMAFLRTPFARSSLIDSSSQTTNIANVSLAKLRPLPFPLPPLAEQSRIVTRVEDLMRLCDALSDKARLEATQHEQLLRTLLGTLTASTTADELTENWHRVATHFDLLLDRPEAVDALEQTILQLAVRGLLVPQHPQDEPAAELLKKIRAEKDRLIAEGKIRRDKPLPPIADDEQPFDLPYGWQWVRLGLLTSLVTSGSRSWKDYYAADGATFIRSQDIKYDRLEFDERAFVKLPSGTEGVRTQVCLRDVLITITGANVGKAAVVSESITEAYVSQHVALVRLHEVRLVDYLHLWLVSEHEGRKLLLASSYGAKPGLNLQNINDLLVPVPPLAEQSRIVASVASLRALCADLRQRLTTACTQQALLAQALVENSV